MTFSPDCDTLNFIGSGTPFLCYCVEPCLDSGANNDICDLIAAFFRKWEYYVRKLDREVNTLHMLQNKFY